MGNSLRRQPYPSIYDPLKTPVTEDVLQIGLIVAFAIIAASFILIIPGIRGWERLWATVRVFVALWIGAVLIVCNFGSWYSDSICTSTQYKAHTKPNTPNLIQATVAISIGLRGMNITLSEVEDGCGSEGYVRPFPGETIHYVESFRWAPSWRQGRLDFGEFGGQFRQRYRDAKYRGMPYPIMRVAESFLFDGDQYRWYRHFRTAGWYTHIWLWTAFATYLITILVFIFNIRHGAYFMLLTGSLLCLSVFTYGILIRNDPPLRIYFPDGFLQPNFNYSFYLTLVTGVLTVLGGLIVLVMDIFYPRKIATFFHHALIEDDAIFEGEIEEESEEGLFERKPSKISYRGAEGKIRRKGTETHVRGSVKSLGGRSDVLPREKSSATLNAPSPPSSPRDNKTEVELEMVTVHDKKSTQDA